MLLWNEDNTPTLFGVVHNHQLPRERFKTHRSNGCICNEIARSFVGIPDQVKGRKFRCNVELGICDKLTHSYSLPRRLMLKEQTLAPKFKPLPCGRLVRHIHRSG